MPAQQQTISANTLLKSISMIPVTGTPTIRIGTTLNGTDIMGDTAISAFKIIKPDLYFAADSIIYITQTLNNGVVNFRFDVSDNYFNFPAS